MADLIDAEVIERRERVRRVADAHQQSTGCDRIEAWTVARELLADQLGEPSC